MFLSSSQDDQLFSDMRETDSIKCRIVHLLLSQWPQFPVRHLLTLTEGLAKDVFHDFSKANLILFFFNSRPVGLDVKETGKPIEESHLGQGLLEHARVTAECKPYA